MEVEEGSVRVVDNANAAGLGKEDGEKERRVCTMRTVPCMTVTVRGVLLGYIWFPRCDFGKKAGMAGPKARGRESAGEARCRPARRARQGKPVSTAPRLDVAIYFPRH